MRVFDPTLVDYWFKSLKKVDLGFYQDRFDLLYEDWMQHEPITPSDYDLLEQLYSDFS